MLVSKLKQLKFSKLFLNNAPSYRCFSQKTLVLGIETSCDDTGCAIINGSGQILGDSLFSQNVRHLRYGGINPLVAHELHCENIEVAVNEVLKKACVKINDIDTIAVTVKPGLQGSLEVGVKYAKYLARLYNKPLIPIHHMEAHALVARMYYDIPFPFLVVLISGANCLLAAVRSVNEFLLLGDTLDNAPGELMDKVARRMKLRNIPIYSQIAGGKAIELAARQAKNPEMFKFPLPLAKQRDCNFSFSGLKDSVERKLIEKELQHGVMGDGIIPEINELCAGFLKAVAEHIAHRTERAIVFCENMNLIESHKNIVVSGGVACNDYIFNSIKLIGGKRGYNVFRPPPKVCTDNGIMIAWNGVEKLKKGLELSNDTVEMDPYASLGKNIIEKVKEANIQVKVTRLKNYVSSTL